MTTVTEARSDQQTLLDQMYACDRVEISAPLAVASGRFLQPTGFPDLDACTYRDKEGKRWCLVESEQSMANRLEAVCMKSPGVWVTDLLGLPLIIVRDGNENLLTTNLVEPHRIASSYILEGKREGDDSEIKKTVESKIGLLNGGDFWPLDKRADLEQLIFALDPAALLHGFQFIQWKFVGLRQTRLVHARLEAELSEEPDVHYGMVKWDSIEPESSREKGANKGQSIAAKSRLVAKDIIATFEIDVLALKNLALEDPQRRLLLGLALWKIGKFLANSASFDPRSRQTGPSLRLRADCYLRLEPTAIRWSGSGGGDGSVGTTETATLVGQLPPGWAKPDKSETPRPGRGSGDAPDPLDFSRLVAAVFDSGDKPAAERPAKKRSAATEKTRTDRSASVYEGPLVEVTYKPKPKKERGPQSTAAPEDPGDQQA